MKKILFFILFILSCTTYNVHAIYFFDNAKKLGFIYKYKLTGNPKLFGISRKIERIAIDNTGENLYYVYTETSAYSKDKNIIIQKTNLKTKHSITQKIHKGYSYPINQPTVDFNDFYLHPHPFYQSLLIIKLEHVKPKSHVLYISKMLSLNKHTLKIKQSKLFKDPDYLDEPDEFTTYQKQKVSMPTSFSLDTNSYHQCQADIIHPNKNKICAYSICQYCLKILIKEKIHTLTFFPEYENRSVGQVYAISNNKKFLAIENPEMHAEYTIEVWQMPEILPN